MDLLQILNWRYATKRMNGAKVSEDKINRILEAVRLSASSVGLQPYTVFVIENKDLLSEIQVIAHNQPQISACSHLLVFAAWDNFSDERIAAYERLFKEVRGENSPGLQNYVEWFKQKAQQTANENFAWFARQAYIALGTALIAAANEQVDSTPMEGFNNEELDKLLNLKEKGLRSVAIMPLGYRDEENDYNVKLAKVRKNDDSLFVRIK
jgi:nitroreductase